MSNSHENTSPTPSKVIKQMSLFLGKFEPQPDNAGWAFKKELADGNGYIRVASRTKLNPADGRMFDYVMHILYSQRRHLFEGKKKDWREVDTEEAYKELRIDISDFVLSREITQDWKNKKAVYESLKKLVGTTIEMQMNSETLLYSLLTSVKQDDVNSNILYVKVNKEVNNSFYVAEMRFINIQRSMPLKGDIPIEYVKFLQTRGSGINSNGLPKLPREFKHSDVVHYLHLEHLAEKEQMNTIRRAIKASVKQGYSAYKMKRTMHDILWIINN